MLEEVTPEEGARGYTVMEIDEKLVGNLAERHGIEQSWENREGLLSFTAT